MAFTCILLAGSLALRSAGARSGGESRDDGVEPQRVLLRHVVDGTRELRIVRGRDRAAEGLQGLVDARLLDQATAVFPVRVELHGEGEPLVLASRLRVEGKPPAVGIAVLNVVFEAGQVVVAVIEGPDLALWTVPIGTGTSSWAVLPAWEWSVSGALEPLDPRHVQVKLVQREGGRIRAEVKDARRDDTVAYEQEDSGAWVLADRDEGAK